jgi:hypothetical protein
MGLSRCIASIVFLVVVGCATPGETRASYRVQGDIQNIINANEIAHGHPFGGSVKDTKVISVQGDTVIEEWHVQRGDRLVVYAVRMTSSPKGGTDIQVTVPKEDQKK